MNNKSRNGLMMIAGGYLVYLGIKLMRDVMNEDVSNSLIFLICAVFFMVVGALIVFYYVKNMIKLNAQESEAAEEEEEAEGIESAEEAQDIVEEIEAEESQETAAEDQAE